MILCQTEQFISLLNISMLNGNPHFKEKFRSKFKKQNKTTKLTVFFHLPLVVSGHADTVVFIVNSFLS